MLEHNSMTIIKPKYVKRGEPVVFDAECPVHEKAAWYIMRVNVKGKRRISRVLRIVRQGPASMMI